jgi:hypothetical protein
MADEENSFRHGFILADPSAPAFAISAPPPRFTSSGSSGLFNLAREVDLTESFRVSRAPLLLALPPNMKGMASQPAHHGIGAIFLKNMLIPPEGGSVELYLVVVHGTAGSDEFI